jgi:hypothetical protein
MTNYRVEVEGLRVEGRNAPPTLIAQSALS